MRWIFFFRVFALILIVQLSCPLPALPAGRPAWKSALARAWRHHQRKDFPNSRLAIRQACAYALEEQDWRAIYEGFVILGLAHARGEPIPEYFFSYLKRAAALPASATSHLALRLLAELYLVHGDKPAGVKLALRAVELALNRGEYGDALAAASLLRPAKTDDGPSEESMQAWLAIARTCLAAQAWQEVLAASKLMLDAGIAGLAHDWINRSAALALAKGDREAVRESARLLRTSGHPDEAQIWETRLKEGKAGQRARQESGR